MISEDPDRPQDASPYPALLIPSPAGLEVGHHHLVGAMETRREGEEEEPVIAALGQRPELDHALRHDLLQARVFGPPLKRQRAQPSETQGAHFVAVLQAPTATCFS